MSKRRKIDKLFPPIAISGGEQCPKCGKAMQRYEHPHKWRPAPNRGWFLYWDRCIPCGHMQHYDAAHVLPPYATCAQVERHLDRQTLAELHRRGLLEPRPQPRVKVVNF